MSEWDINNCALDYIIRVLRDGDRWRRFFVSPLWLVFPALGAVAFGVVWLILRGDAALTVEEVRSEAWQAAILTCLAWVAGMWASSGNACGREYWVERAAREGRPSPTLRQKLILGAILAAALLIVAGLIAWEVADTTARTDSLRQGLACGATWLFLIVGGICPFIIRSL